MLGCASGGVTFWPGTLRNLCHTNIDVVMPLPAGSCSMSSSVIGVGDQTAAAARVLRVGRWESLLLFLRSEPGRQGSVSIKNVRVGRTLSSLSTFALIHHSRSPCIVGCLIVIFVAVVVHVAIVIACCCCSCCCCCCSCSCSCCYCCVVTGERQGYRA